MTGMMQSLKAAGAAREPRGTEIGALTATEIDQVAGAGKICVYWAGGEVTCHVPKPK